MRRAPGVFESFNFAFEGIIHVLRTQRNMRIHFAIAAGVLILALAIGVTKLELIALMLSIAFVLIAEMINSAIEGAIDVATTSFDPMAKLAKDMAAGAVLVATVNAVAVGYLVFSGQVADRSTRLIDRLTNAPAKLTVIALALTLLFVIAVKAYTGRGTPGGSRSRASTGKASTSVTSSAPRWSRFNRRISSGGTKAIPRSASSMPSSARTRRASSTAASSSTASPLRFSTSIVTTIGAAASRSPPCAACMPPPCAGRACAGPHPRA